MRFERLNGKPMLSRSTMPMEPFATPSDATDTADARQLTSKMYV
jgi:hypothetical protein